MNIYDYQRPVGKVDDLPELRNAFISLYDAKSHAALARFCLAYGRHLCALTGFCISGAVAGADTDVNAAARAFAAIEEWLDGKTWYQKARSVGGEFNDLARAEPNAVKARFYRTMAQIACVPHVKYHALWATDYAVTLINRMFPADLAAVKKERETQIELLKGI